MNKYTQSKFKSSKHYINKESKLKRILPYAFILVFSLSICAVVYIGIANAISYHIVPPQVASGGETNMGKTALTVPELIKQNTPNVSNETALRIADCESKMGKYHKNLMGGSDTGLYQFLPSTWNAYCDGDINDHLSQIKCFDKLYPTHPNWWVCK